MPWTFIWKDISGVTLQTTLNSILPDTIIGLSQGTYTLEIIDGNGCSSTWTKPLGTVNSMQVNVVAVSMTSCAVNTCDATASAVVFNGTSPYSYLWSSGDTVSMATTLCSGLNYLFVTDANGCVDTSAFTVNTPNPISVSAYGDTTICISNTTNIGSIALGGTPPYSYNWNSGLATTSNVNVSPATTQTYLVVVTDSKNCPSDSDSVVITVRPPLALSFPNPDTVCPGETSTLIAVPSGGDGFYNFVWEQGLGTSAGVQVQVSTSQFYSVTLTDGCGTTPAVDSVWLQVGGFPPLKVDVTPDDTICIGDPFYLFAQGIGGDKKYTYEWDNGLGFGQTHAVKPTQFNVYTVTVTDQCLTPAGVGSVTVSVGNFENFNPLVDTNQNCDPGTFVFGFDTLNSKFRYEMNFGDGYRIVDPFSPIERTFTEDGCRDISVKLITDYGCVTEKNYPCFVTVLPRPVADFDFESHQPDITEFAVDFWDKSKGATEWTWYADQTFLSDTNKFTHLFPNDGTYNIRLIVSNEYQCTDSLDTDLTVRFVTNYYIPTAFTPNGDQINDEFTIVGEGVQLADFEMQIFDRWGGEVFTTTSRNVGWNGKFQNSGDELQTGTYAYVITFRIQNGRKITEFGTVNLLK
jgi:gliding motility-associated-like protein